MSAQLTQSCRVIGLLSDLTPETIRHYEWKSNGTPRKDVVRYTVGNLTYLVAGHPATHAEALKPSLVESYSTIGEPEAFAPRISARDIVARTERDYEGLSGE